MVLQEIISRDEFEKFFVYYKAEKIEGGDRDWESVVSPYSDGLEDPLVAGLRDMSL